jgi:hypothetical protein
MRLAISALSSTVDIDDQVVLGQAARIHGLLLDIQLFDVVALQRAIGLGEILDLDALGVACP